MANKQIVDGQELIVQIMGLLEDVNDEALMAAYRAVVGPVKLISDDQFEIGPFGGEE